MTNEEARKEIQRWLDGCPWADTKEAFELAINALKERPQGMWVVYGKQGDIPITDKCTNCNYEMKWYKTKYNFCPNCGADMGGARND